MKTELISRGAKKFQSSEWPLDAFHWEGKKATRRREGVSRKVEGKGLEKLLCRSPSSRCIVHRGWHSLLPRRVFYIENQVNETGPSWRQGIREHYVPSRQFINYYEERVACGYRCRGVISLYLPRSSYLTPVSPFYPLAETSPRLSSSVQASIPFSWALCYQFDSSGSQESHSNFNLPCWKDEDF